MIPDKYKKTVKIPIKVVDNEFKFFYGGELPKILDGAIGEIILPAYAIKNDYRVDKIGQRTRRQFLPKNTTLLVKISSKSNSYNSGFLKKMKVFPPTDELFAIIQLLSDLEIELRGTKKPELCKCPCFIQALPETKARSLNHAYTLLSEKFETHRMSHTGNIFEQIYVQNKSNEWVQIEELRSEMYEKFEYELNCLGSKWWIKKLSDNKLFWSCISKSDREHLTIYVIDQESNIHSENYFSIFDFAEKWLNENGFIMATPTEYNTNYNPPMPPYSKPDGEEIFICILGGKEGI